MTLYSVLMPVYIREKPEYLQMSIDSMLRQTVPPSEFVVVCDGPLTPELDAVLEGFIAGYPGVFHVVRLEKNQGLGGALCIGIVHCQNELIARMDSDDVAVPGRCALQLDIFSREDVDIVGGTVGEFEDDPENILRYRSLPECHSEILRCSRSRNPFNHPAVMYRKSAVLAAGNYRSCAWFEDYDLWLRMLRNGARAYNIQQSILNMRVSADAYRRRGGWKYFCSMASFLWHMKKNRLCGWGDFCGNFLCRGVLALMPNSLRARIYRGFLREKVSP